MSTKKLKKFVEEMQKTKNNKSEKETNEFLYHLTLKNIAEMKLSKNNYDN